MTRRHPARRTNRDRRRFAAVVIAFVGCVGLGVASAAQLAIAGSSLGSGSAVVASCQPAGQVVSVGFTTGYSSGAYRATRVVLSNVNGACAGLQYQLQLTNATGAPVGSEVTGIVTLSGSVMTVAVPATPATSIGGVAAIIHG